mgnify:CR=1 FL=1
MPSSKKNAAGCGNIRKKTVTKNGKDYTYWEARYTAGYDPGTGKQIQKSITGKTQSEVAKKLKNNPRKYDFLKAYEERIKFFEEKNMPEQVMKTKEKICTDIILRYCEQMTLDKKYRDTDCTNGTYIKIYRKNFRNL